MTTIFRRYPAVLVLAIVAVIIMAGIAWWLGSPLFLSQAVNDVPIASNISTGSADAAMMAANNAQPVSVKAGSFRNGDDFHRGSGQAVIYKLPDGTHRLQLENFNVTNGPDLFVVFTSHANPTTSTDVHSEGYIELARLKGNLGNQVYDLPATVDLNGARSVVIYCRAFSVVFSVAPLEVVTS
jgi:hypothetical protein